MLGDYIDWAIKQPWGWGREPGMDCCKFAARWVVRRGHSDPMDYIVGRYDSAIGALSLIRRNGGLVPLWTRGMIEAVVPEADDPRAGDVAIIRVATDDGTNEACGIYTGDKWLTLGQRGIEAQPAEPLMIWRP